MSERDAGRAAPVYLDHAATTPMLPAAVEALADEAARTGNPSSVHAAGRAARRVVEDARELVADRLGAHPTEVVFTSGGTEADNLAVLGLARGLPAAPGSSPGSSSARPRVLVSAVEHHAVLDPAAWLGKREGAQVTLIPVDAAGRVRVEALDEALAAGRPGAVVSVMWANNEVGTVQPVAEVVAAARAHGGVVHADAAQAVGRLPVDLRASGLDALTVSAHKLGGPVGIGALLVRRDAPLAAVLHGGGQERGLRPGTIPAALVRSFAVALDVATREREQEAVRLAGLRDALVAGILREVPDAVVRGPWPDRAVAGGGTPAAAARLPGNAHLTFPGCDSEALLFGLDRAGIAASAGSACQAGVQQASHVLEAMGVGPADARGALRLSLGWSSTPADVAAVVAVIGGVVAQARAAASA